MPNYLVAVLIFFPFYADLLGFFLSKMVEYDQLKQFDIVPKLYIPSTLNIALLQWHTHLNVCAVK